LRDAWLALEPTTRDLLDPVAAAVRFWEKPAADAPIGPYDVDRDKTAAADFQDGPLKKVEVDPKTGKREEKVLPGSLDLHWDRVLDPLPSRCSWPPH
jgi:hypothetical protein